MKIGAARGRAFSPVTVFSGSLVVPADFLGVHFHRWPLTDGVLAPAPTYQFGLTRSHDTSFNATGSLTWRGLNPSSGVYDWATMDAWVDAHYSAGRQLLYTLYQTPTWAAANTGANDAYGYAGGGSPPSSLSSITTFVTQLVTRYNGSNPKRLKFLQVWNEPKFDGLTTGFYWGTAADMAAFARAVYQAAKAVDSSIIVLSPGFHATSLLQAYLTASDGAAGTGALWQDAVAYHAYQSWGGTGIPGAGLANSTLTAIVRDALTAGGMSGSTPIYCTEMGYGPNPSDPLLLSRTPAQLARWVQHTATWAAINGWKAWTFYDHDGALIGNPSTNPVVAQALQWVHSTLAGRTLILVRRFGDSLEITTDAGVTVLA